MRRSEKECQVERKVAEANAFRKFQKNECTILEENLRHKWRETTIYFKNSMRIVKNTCVSSLPISSTVHKNKDGREQSYQAYQVQK